MILIPVKNLSAAKQRLAAVLDQSARTELAQTMLHDVVTALAAWPQRPPCTLVTGDPFAIELAEQYDFELIPDRDNPGETGAIDMATRLCEARGIDNTLVIPADIPLLQASDLEQIFAQAPVEGTVLAPAADGRGTNAAFRRPANLFPLRFGNDSFKPHLAAAQATGKPCIVLQLPSLAVDVDNPEDLRHLVALPGEIRTQRLVRQWILDGRLIANDIQPRSGKLGLLVRRNKGRTEHPYYATELSHLLKIEIRPTDVLGLEDTDRLFAIHRAHSIRSTKEPDFAFRKVWKYEPAAVWLRTCQCLEERLQRELAVLFAGPYEFCGGLRVGADRALKAVIPLLEFDQNTVGLQSVSSESGLFLDLFEQDSEWLIELVAWGQWKTLAEECRFRESLGSAGR